MENEKLIQTIDAIGGMRPAASVLGITWQAVQKMRERGLPRTEFTGETEYAKTMAKIAKKKGLGITATDLLQEAKQNFQRVSV